MNAGRLTGLLAAAALALSGCGEQDSPAGSAIPESEPFNQADVDFATEMVPHHAQALLMVDSAAPRDDLSPEVAALVEKIRTEQTGEIEVMTDLLEDWGQPIPDNPRDHGGLEHGSTDDMDMPGLATEEEMAALDRASGVEFEELWLEMMIEHHEGAITMAQDEFDAGEDADAVSLAEGIISAQADEVGRMERLLGG